jgi:RNA polymerase sigma-70 factor (ECF subfamily)
MSDSTRTSWRLTIPPRSAVGPPELASMTDGQLMECVATRHPAALAEIVTRHGGVMTAVATRAIGEGGSDVVQDVFARLWQSPAVFDSARGALRSFLIVQVRSRAIDVMRTESARRAREERDESSDRRATEEASVLDVLYSHETLGTLLDGLAPEERQPICLAFFEGYTYREVASMLGIPEGTIKSRIRAGLQRLRAGLTADTARNHAT